MIILADIDDTQREIARHLTVTESLLARTVSAISGSERSAVIRLMPDLGFSNSVQRMHGGFFTGMVATWECAEPFVPVDATVNVCSVGIYRIATGDMPKEEFLRRIRATEERARAQSSYVWNFESGNHFITLAEVGLDEGIPAGRYLVLHSSACEFKSQSNGLYPVAGNWYSAHVLLTEDGPSGRYLRYLRGVPAERFIRLAHHLVEYNRMRLQYFAESIVSAGVAEEVLYVPHYGMPDYASIAIGCQWVAGDTPCVLLTAPGHALLVVRPFGGGENDAKLAEGEVSLMPHGLGVAARAGVEVGYADEGLWLNNRLFPRSGSLRGVPELAIRGVPATIATITAQVLARCPGRVVARLRPLFSYPEPKKERLICL